MSLNDKATAALKRELARAFPERAANDPGHDRLAEALTKPTHTPELLEACKALLRMIDGLPWQLRDAAYKAFNERTGGLPGSLPSPISKGRAAIAKAEGGAK